jgi:hypothetical protein
MEAKGSGDVLRKFNHPFVQACSMFIGEVLCLLVFKFLYFYYWRKHVSNMFTMCEPMIYVSCSHHVMMDLPDLLTDVFSSSKFKTEFFHLWTYFIFLSKFGVRLGCDRLI